ncbi:MAG: serine/threonine-protein kinase [Polyangia bacterium]
MAALPPTSSPPYKRCPSCQQIYRASSNFCVRDRTQLLSDERILVGKYILLSQIGAGRMSDVFVAEQPHLGRRVAIKLLHHDPEVMRRFDSEVLAVGRIKHDHVVTIHDSGWTDEGRPYLAMEYLEGQDLAAALRQHGPIPSERALVLWMQAVQAVAAAHRSQVIHRDLKPANLLLTIRDGDDGPEEIVKVIDFSIAKVTDARDEQRPTSPGSLLGTMPYMAPEQLARGEALPASDVYSLGVVLVEMMTGTVPPAKPADRGQVSVALLRMVNQSTASLELSPQRPLSGQLLELVNAMLSPFPEARPEDAGALLRRVKELPEVKGWARSLSLPRALSVRRETPTPTPLGARSLPAPPHPVEGAQDSSQPSLTEQVLTDAGSDLSIAPALPASRPRPPDPPDPQRQPDGPGEPGQQGMDGWFPGSDFGNEEPTLPTTGHTTAERDVRALVQILSQPASTESLPPELTRPGPDPGPPSSPTLSAGLPAAEFEAVVPAAAAPSLPAESAVAVPPPVAPALNEEHVPTLALPRPRSRRGRRGVLAAALLGALVLLALVLVMRLRPGPRPQAAPDLGAKVAVVVDAAASDAAGGDRDEPAPASLAKEPADLEPATPPADLAAAVPAEEGPARVGADPEPPRPTLRVRFVVRAEDGVAEVRCRGQQLAPRSVIELGAADACEVLGTDGSRHALSYAVLARVPRSRGGVRRYHPVLSRSAPASAPAPAVAPVEPGPPAAAPAPEPSPSP